MKKDNKKVQNALVAMVLLIWGTVGYRMLNWNGSGENYSASSSTYIPLAKVDQHKRDSFVIQANYRDPFLNKSSSNTPVKTSRASSSSKKYQRKAPPSVKGLQNKSKVKPPQFKYLGYSLNNNEITRVRISIDGRAFTFKLHEKKEKIRVKAMHKDSIIIRYRGAEQTLFRK